MSDEKLYEITVEVRSKDETSVRHIEGPLDHTSTEDVAADVVTHLDSRSRGKLKTIPGTER
jgi:hypothetical protein